METAHAYLMAVTDMVIYICSHPSELVGFGTHGKFQNQLTMRTKVPLYLYFVFNIALYSLSYSVIIRRSLECRVLSLVAKCYRASKLSCLVDT